MANTLNCRGFLMLTVYATLCTVADIISKSACTGDSVLIFQNITSAKFNKTITLYKMGAGKQDTMALWVLNDSNVESIVLERYRPKVSFVNGSIILQNIESTDEATYALLYDKDTSTKIETKILTLVPPTHPCKPKIRQDENVLFAFLDNSQYCGQPQVSVQWMEYPGISYIGNKTVLVVPSGKDASTYYACIEGEALTCTRTSAEREYCVHITIGSTRIESIPIPSNIQQIQTLTVVITALVSLILLVAIASLISLWKQCRIRPKDPARASPREQRIDRSSSQNRNVTDHEACHDDPEYETAPLEENIEMREI